MATAPETRLRPARRRAAAAKVVLASGGALAFVAAAALARVAYPGHAKRPVRSLSPPQRFVEIVRKNQLQAGILAPAQASPDVTSSTS
jgi:hypothetical protein